MTNSDKPLHGKTCLVTGATSGMGEMTARALAQRGATVIVVGRNPEKGAATVNQIKQQTNNLAVEFMLADCSVQAQVRQLAEEFKRQHQYLHVLVNNAGALFLGRQMSADGIEMTFALNHLGYFLLTNLLLGTLQASTPARIINISSVGHKRGRMNFEDLQSRQRYNGMQAYRQSKLANVLFTYELARRLQGTGVTVNAVGPSYVATNFAFNNFGIMPDGVIKLLIRLYGLVGTNAERGAQTAIYLATSADVEDVTGKYFEGLTAVPSSNDSYSAVAASRLWQMSAELTGLATVVH